MKWLEKTFTNREDYRLFLRRTGHTLVAWGWILTGVIWTLGFFTLTTDLLPKRIEDLSAVFMIVSLLLTFLVYRLIIKEQNRLNRG